MRYACSLETSGPREPSRDAGQRVTAPLASKSPIVSAQAWPPARD